MKLAKLFIFDQKKGLCFAESLHNTKKLREYGQYEAYQKLMESFKARDQPVEI